VVDNKCIRLGKICSTYNDGNGLMHNFLIKTVINSIHDYYFQYKKDKYLNIKISYFIKYIYIYIYIFFFFLNCCIYIIIVISNNNKINIYI